MTYEPARKFRIIRGKSSNYKVSYYASKESRDAAAKRWADKDGERVLCELWEAGHSQDELNQGWAMDASVGGPPDTPESLAAQLRRFFTNPDSTPVAWTRIALTGMCLEAREAHPTAKYVVLVDSDQGDYAVWIRTEDAEGNSLDDWPSDDYSWAGNLWDSARAEMQPYTDTPYDRRNPWEGTKFDIDRVLGTS